MGAYNQAQTGSNRATDQPIYWLMKARLFELDLVCAGHYADNCEFTEKITGVKIVVFDCPIGVGLINQLYGRDG